MKTGLTLLAILFFYITFSPLTNANKPGNLLDKHVVKSKIIENKMDPKPDCHHALSYGLIESLLSLSCLD